VPIAAATATEIGVAKKKSATPKLDMSEEWAGYGLPPISRPATRSDHAGRVATPAADMAGKIESSALASTSRSHKAAPHQLSNLSSRGTRNG